MKTRIYELKADTSINSIIKEININPQQPVKLVNSRVSVDKIIKYIVDILSRSAVIELDLDNLYIRDDEGAKSIVDGLKDNHTLTSLNLHNNKIGAEGGKSIVDGLKDNYTLTSLSVGFNNIGAKGNGEISDYIERNKLYTTELAHFIKDNQGEFDKIYDGNLNNLVVKTIPTFCPDLEDLINIQTFSPPKGVFSFFALLSKASKLFLHECINWDNKFDFTMNNLKLFTAGNFFKYICKSFGYQTIEQQGQNITTPNILNFVPQELIAKITYGLKPWNKSTNNENKEINIVDITDEANPVSLVVYNSPPQIMINPINLLNLADQLQQQLLLDNNITLTGLNLDLPDNV
jgi:Leucine Rich repeat